MPSTAPWARYDPRIRLVIDGKEIPCVRCNVDYELSAIPQASATLAVGRSFEDVPSPVHDLAAGFVDRVPAQIYINPFAMGQDAQSAMGAGDLGLGGDEQKIFEGFATSAGFTRSRGHAQFNVQMEHWLSEMGFSSIFSKTSHPGNPGYMAFGALAPIGTSAGATGVTAASWSTTTIGNEFFSPGSITSDFWGDCLLPFFKEICKNDSFMEAEIAVGGPGGDLGTNDGAMDALNRFNSKYQQKLALQLSQDADVANNIMTFSSSAVGNPDILANQTLWDVLVHSFCGQFLFWIVPRVDDAIAAPFMPCYRESYLTITANEETQIEWMRGMIRPIRGVGMMANVRSTAGSEMPGEGAEPSLGVGGYYTPGQDTKGIVIIKRVPDWMTALYAPSKYGMTSTGADGKTAIGNAVQPGGDAQPAGVKDQVKQRLKEDVKPFLDRYAHALYAIEKLSGRQAVCSCPFRLDVAPGSTIKVEAEGETHTAGDQLAAPFYAHVARVSIAVDAEQPMIGTSFHLSHIRSEKENGDDRTSVDNHPLYEETFKGCPLVD